jgi:hypothetical protein
MVTILVDKMVATPSRSLFDLEYGQISGEDIPRLEFILRNSGIQAAVRAIGPAQIAISGDFEPSSLMDALVPHSDYLLNDIKKRYVTFEVHDI